MIDEVFANRVMAIHRECDFQLGPDAVHGTDEHRISMAAGVESEQASEATDLTEHFAAVGGGEQPGQRAFDPVAEINVNAPAVVWMFIPRSEVIDRGFAKPLITIDVPEVISPRA